MMHNDTRTKIATYYFINKIRKPSNLFVVAYFSLPLNSINAKTNLTTQLQNLSKYKRVTSKRKLKVIRESGVIDSYN